MGIKDRLKNKGRKGFRQPSKKDLQSKEAEEMKKAQNFLDKYKKVCEETGLMFDIKYVFDETNGLTAQFKLTKYTPPTEMKLWSVALKENLELRKECQHQLHKEMTKCSKCELNPENWNGDRGVKPEYEEKMLKEIAEQEEKEQNPQTKPVE